MTDNRIVSLGFRLSGISDLIIAAVAIIVGACALVFALRSSDAAKRPRALLTAVGAIAIGVACAIVGVTHVVGLGAVDAYQRTFGNMGAAIARVDSVIFILVLIAAGAALATTLKHTIARRKAQREARHNGRAPSIP